MAAEEDSTNKSRRSLLAFSTTLTSMDLVQQACHYKQLKVANEAAKLLNQNFKFIVMTADVY
jgi:hypothetical protein